VNRERLLFVVVLAILALWFVMREAPQPVSAAEPQSIKVEPLAVRTATLEQQTVELSSNPYEIKTNARPTQRPMLSPPAERELPNIWLPTSASLGVERWGALRHPLPAPVADDASVQLPDLPGAETTGSGAPATQAADRTDEWTSFNQPGRGEVVAMVINGKRQAAPKELPDPGPLTGWIRSLLMLEIDPGKVQADGLTSVEVRVEVGGQRAGTVTQAFPGDIHDFRIAVAGRRKAWYDGAKAYLRLPDAGFNRHLTVARDLIERGRKGGETDLLRWAQVMLDEARERVPAANQVQLRDITLSMLEVANALNDEERVLALAFDHLSRFPREEVVIEYVGNLLASRSFGLLRQAEQWLARAPGSRSAQVSRVRVLLRLGDYEEALNVIRSGRAGGGADVDLLHARAALAVGDLETARNRARSHGGGDQAAEANQILGGIAYAEGDAAGAQDFFLRAVQADPGNSSAYSDLGLAFAAQGLEADANACFDRATALDFENTVTPGLARSLMRVRAAMATIEQARATLAGLDPRKKQNDKPRAAAEAAVTGGKDALGEQVTALGAILDNNPRDLLVRYCQGYAQELSGDLDAAAAAYRAVLDTDYRYRIAIARLGVVEAKRVMAGGDRALLRESVNDLRKSISLNPAEPVLPYLLGRVLFLEGGDERATEADRAFAAVETLPPPKEDPDLVFWAQYARAALLYRDARTEELKVKQRLNTVIDDIRARMARIDPANQDRLVQEHPVYQAVLAARETVDKYQSMVDIEWEFAARPRDWDIRQREQMSVSVQPDPEDPQADGEPDGKLVFRGTVNFGGNERNNENILEYCAVEWPGKDSSDRLAAGDFYQVVWKGSIGEKGAGVEFGLGLVGKGRSRRGPAGIQIRRKATGRMELRLDGGDSELLKRVRDNWVELDVEWPIGPYQVRIEVVDRRTGEFKLFLDAGNRGEINVIQQSQIGREDGRETEECSLFGSGRGSNPISIVAWVEGRDGYEFDQIELDTVRVTQTK